MKLTILICAVIAVACFFIWKYFRKFENRSQEKYLRKVAHQTAELSLTSSDLFSNKEKSKSLSAQLSTVLDIAEDAIIAINESYEILMFNKGAEKIFGYHADEIIGKSLNKLLPQKFHESHNQQISEFGDSDKEKRYMAERGAVSGLRKNGEEFPAEASISKIKVGGELIFTVILRDVSERYKVENALRKSVTEKEVLLKEVHHRVKNNLQIISSLLNLQLRKTEDREAFKAIGESKDRIRSIALIHEMLYRSTDLAEIRFSSYVEELTRGLMKMYGRGSDIEVQIEAGDISVSLEDAVPCGLIVNELVANSLKHGFGDFEKGRICISLKLDDKDMFFLEVSDNGKGVSKVKDILESKSLGMKLVFNLAQQLQGNCELSVDDGVKILITFPNRNHINRQ